MKLMIKRNSKLGQRGQGSVEYIMMLLVISVIIYSVMGKFKAYFGSEAKNCNSNSATFICMVKKSFNTDGAQPFKYYTLR